MAVITYKCPNCGGDLRFHPESQKFRCEYCLSELTQEELEQQSQEELEQPQKELEQQSQEEETDGQGVFYSCPSCGAEIVTDETTTATFCYYCHNPVVLAGKMQGRYHPDQVIPFTIDRDQALNIFEQWIGRKKYVPRAFYSKNQIDTMTGVYFPYWLYSCRVKGKLDAQGLKNKTWVTGNIRYTQTQKFDVVRDGQMEVEHVARNALSKANRKLVEGVFPFEMDKLQSFHMSYLSGFMAENRDMEEAAFASEVKQEVEGFASASLKSQVAGYDSLEIRGQSADLSDERWDYSLLPVWTLTYKEPKSDNIFYFACNGQTGKVCGELPVDSGRLMMLFASIFVPLLVVLLIVGYII